jgi:hypothetical protein
MKRFALAAMLTMSLLPATVADARRSHHYSHVGDYGGADDYYVNHVGHSVHRPVMTARRPAGATARCRDGSWSFSESRRGTCSHHGGVSQWLK